MEKDSEILLAYYGDDFTGSTDSLESLCLSGVNTVLFMKPPTSEMLITYKDIQAIGIAGLTRSMSPGAMEAELLDVFLSIKKLNVKYIHYKVCSTFDSSPETGSIGKVIDTALKIFKISFIPVLVGTPALGRYCLFGNLFARMGKEGSIYRLDRHPSISKHPVTPMKESDLILHLSCQTKIKTGLIDILKLSESIEKITATIDSFIQNNTRAVLFDTLTMENLLKIAGILEVYVKKNKPLFSIGSSAIGSALGALWQKDKTISSHVSWPKINKIDILLVASGSCSPVTSSQIKKALTSGFVEIALDTISLVNDEKNDYIITETSNIAIGLIRKGKSVIIHTCMGDNDIRLEKTRKILDQKKEKKGMGECAALFGNTLGLIIKKTMEQTGVRRLLIAGGDTSGYIARQIGIESLTMIAPLTPGAPLCRANIPGSSLDGIEINFKGGQIGETDYFEKVRIGQ